MTRNNRSFLGVITTPYQRIEEKTIFKPYIEVGYAPKQKAFRFEGEEQKWSELKKPQANNPKIIATSERVTNLPVNDIASELETQIRKFGGSGRKVSFLIFQINAVIQGSVDAMVYIKTGNCRWDSCAGEAIVKAMGGVFTNQHGQQIDYESKAESYKNNEGNICTFDHELHKRIVEIYARISQKK